MNRLTNSFLLALFFPILSLAIIVGFDFPLEILRTSGANLPYKVQMFAVLGVLISALSVNRSIRRWVALYTVMQKTRFVFTTPISDERRKRVGVYSISESVLLFVVGTTLFQLCHEAFICSMAFWFFSLEGLLFLVWGRKNYAVGLSSKAIIVADREVTVIYFSGLRKVSISQQTLYFDYIASLQLAFPVDCLPESSRKDFLVNLEKVTDKEKVLIQNLGLWKT